MGGKVVILTFKDGESEVGVVGISGGRVCDVRNVRIKTVLGGKVVIISAMEPRTISASE